MGKRLIGIYGLLLVFIAAGCSGSTDELEENEGAMGEETGEESTEAGLDYEGEGGLLWKVVHGETTMYLQGTIHLGHEDFYPLASEIEEAYEQADVILPEINMFEAEVNEAEINELALFEDDTNLRDVLAEASYDKLSDIFEINELTLEDYEDFQPWFVGTLLNELSNQDSELAPEYGVDLYFLQKALEDNKEIVELETIKMQYDILSGYSMETQIQMLESTINSFEEIGSSLDKLGHYWIHNNTEGLVGQISEGLGSFDEEYQQRLNDQRNLDMADKLDEILLTNDGQTYFAIIGSAHVLIDPSVPGELEKRGYEIERIQ